MNAPLIPDIDAFEERAAIAEYESGLIRKQAEDSAAQAQSFSNADHYWQCLMAYMLSRSAVQARGLKSLSVQMSLVGAWVGTVN